MHGGSKLFICPYDITYPAYVYSYGIRMLWCPPEFWVSPISEGTFGHTLSSYHWDSFVVSQICQLIGHGSSLDVMLIGSNWH